MGPRQWSAMLFTIYCLLSLSRLLLVLSPATFMNIKWRRGFYITGLCTIAVSVFHTFSAVLCNKKENYNPQEHWRMVMNEIGLGKGKCIWNSTYINNLSSTHITEPQDCLPIPIVSILIILTVVFDIVKYIVFITNRVKVKLSLINSQNLVSVMNPRTLQEEPSSTIKELRDRQSLAIQDPQQLDEIQHSPASNAKFGLDQDVAVPSHSKIVTAVIHVDVKPSEGDALETDNGKVESKIETVPSRLAKTRIQMQEIDSFVQVSVDDTDKSSNKRDTSELELKIGKGTIFSIQEDYNMPVTENGATSEKVIHSKSVTAVIHVDVKPSEGDVFETDNGKVENKIKTIPSRLTKTRNQMQEIDSFVKLSVDDTDTEVYCGTPYKNINKRDTSDLEFKIGKATIYSIQEDYNTLVTDNGATSEKVNKQKFKGPKKSKNQIQPERNVKSSSTRFWKEIMDDIKLLFYRTGTYMTFGTIFIIIIGVSWNMFAKRFDISQCNSTAKRSVYIGSRIIAFFNPLVWVAFDSNIRSYVAEKGKKLVDSFISYFNT